ncbi:MAG: lactonase family protein [Oribacterium sp.]|nr:lactonase family protein [Oribacterium sp.]MBP3806717.1 lactonase family protein [Oribacterium sp.]
MIAYIGCRTTKERNARGKGISVYRVDGDKWTLLEIYKEIVNPSYLCLNKRRDRLYSIHGDFSEVSSFGIKVDGTLEYINTVKTHGTNPVHLTLEQTGKYLYVANLQTGAVSVIPVLEDGSLGLIKDMYFISGNGGPGYISHPHQVNIDHSGRWLLVPSQGRLQGIGKVTVFKINPENGALEEISKVVARTGAEPRHIILHPNNKYAYLVNEKDSTVTFYNFDDVKGELVPKQILTSLPSDYFGDGWASAIAMSGAGDSLYLSNRKHDSVSVYRIEQETGYMTYIQNITTKGQQPRFICMTPDDSYLLAANELTDTITVFNVDKNTGMLSDSGSQIETESPVCVAFNTNI